MSLRSHVAAIRFGHGLRLGEAPPSDPVAWLEGQLGPAEPLPDLPDVGARLRARRADIAARQQAQQDTPATGQPRPAPMPTEQASIVREDLARWLRHRAATTQGYRERLVDFWMNHFTVSRRNGTAGLLAAALERDAIRPHVLGRFADMLAAVTRHPAMLVYLDNNGSVGPSSPFGLRRSRGLNENLAREILELQTLSPAGGYTQGDVTEFAKILTGWSVELNREPLGFVFRPETHEPGEKHLLGRRYGAGQEAGEAALRDLAHHPATMRHIAVKLVRHFVADDPPPDAVRAVAAALGREGNLGAAARALIHLPEAWDPPLRKFRTPQDYVVAICRTLDLPLEGNRAQSVVGALGALDQAVWNAPQPNGWPDTRAAWAVPEALMRRVDLAYSLAGRAGARDLAAVTETALGPLARAETVREMRRAGSVRDALTLLFSSPEFMHR